MYSSSCCLVFEPIAFSRLSASGEEERKKDKNLHGQLDTTTSKGSFANYKPFFAFSPKKRIEKGGTDHLLLEDQISTKSWKMCLPSIHGILISIEYVENYFPL